MIQPGASIVADGSYCTLNWIYDGTGSLAGKVYGGTAAHCVEEVGQVVSLADGSLGTAVLAMGSVAYIDDNLDYAFIEIDQRVLAAVHPAMKGHPQIPTGVSTTQTAQTGDVIQFSGNGVGFHPHPLTQEKRVGVLSYNDGVEHFVDGAVTPGDSGGPVADVTDGNKALGIVNTVGLGVVGLPYVGEGGISMEGMLADAADAEFTVELRTAGSTGPGTGTRVQQITATAAGGSIEVTGMATFLDIANRVGDDPVGDASISGPTGGAAPVGDDLTNATIARPNPFDDTMTFTVGVANLPPELDGAPEALRYHWHIAADDAETLTLEAFRTDLAEQGTEPVFRILHGSTVVADVAGTMADGIVKWHVPMDVIGIHAGTVIKPGENVVALDADGTIGDSIAIADYQVGEPTVRIGIAPAGTPTQDVPLNDTAAVQPDGAFTGALPAPAHPGEYTVVVEACNGPGDCARETTTITV